MKRTAVLFALAAGLGLMALAIKLIPKHEPTVVTQPTPIPSPPTTPFDIPPPPGPQTAGDVLKLTASLSDPYLLAGGNREVFLRADIEAAQLPGAKERAPVNMALVLDRSGSMAGEKIENCRKAARQLVSQLDERDRFALVTFGSDVTTLISSTPVTPAARSRMLSAIDGVLEMGGTNISGGLDGALAELVAHRRQYPASRLVLLSDGQANEGIADPAGLSALARRIAAQGITLSAIGVGLDFNEYVMESLAEYGGGSYHFLSNVEQLASIFGSELKQATQTVAVGPTLSFAPAAGVRVAEAYGYLAEAQSGVTTIRLPDFTAGQRRSVVLRLEVAADKPGTLAIARTALSFADATRGGTLGTAQVAISASVTPDPALAQSSRNKDVAVEAVHAGALQSLRSAGISYKQGKRDEAGRQTQEARKMLEKAEALYGHNADFDKALNETQAFEGAISAPADSEAGNLAAKRVHAFSNNARH
jgi:Ca-activated chloride channel family protein